MDETSTDPSPSVYDVDPVYFALNEFEQHDEVLTLIDKIPDLIKRFEESGNDNEKIEQQNDIERAFERYIYILNQYQEQPQLIDSYIEKMVDKTLTHIQHDSNMKLVHLAGNFLYYLIKVRGFKVMTNRFLPHEPYHLIVVLNLIEREISTIFVSIDTSESWMTIYSLLIWLGTTCMVPLDLCRFDNKTKTQTTMNQILNICKKYLYNWAYMRIIAFIIGHFMSRQDCVQLCLNDYINNELIPIISQYDPNSDEDIMLKINACLQTLCYIFKFGQRENLLPHVQNLLTILTEKQYFQSKRLTIRRLTCKLLQKLGTTLLRMPQHGAKWRYKRGVRNLQENLLKRTTGLTSENKQINGVHNHPETNGYTNEFQRDTAESSEDDDDDRYYNNVDVLSDKGLETIIQMLISGLSDKELYVRWSSAKGIGRITNRLKKSYADELVLLLCDRIDKVALLACDHCTLQGGCLTLAELARRGLLLPTRLSIVIPIVLKSLNYDEKLGHQTYGHVVRDAACYICWAFARAFNPADFQSYTTDLACMLLCIICFDWNVQCRRAASAALQENVGRQGDYFPHGIDIILKTDYSLIGNVNYCYIELAQSIAKYEVYRYYMIEHLLKYKVCHWNKETRILTSKILEILTLNYCQIDHIYDKILFPLLEQCLDKKNDALARHGLLFSCGHIVLALCQRQQQKNNVEDDKQERENKTILRQKIENLLIEYRQLGYLDGYIGDVIRPGLCSFICNVSCSLNYFLGIKHDESDVFSLATINCWQTILDDCISSFDEDVRQISLNALKHFADAFYQKSGQTSDDNFRMIIERYLIKIQTTSHEHIRQGFSLALVLLPDRLLLTLDNDNLHNIIDCLLKLTVITQQTQSLINQRKDAIIALFNLCANLKFISITLDIFSKIINCYIRCTKDYTNDRRGDCGRLVRETSCVHIVKLLQLTVSTNKQLDYLNINLINSILCALLEQICSKIDDTRYVAGCSLVNLLNEKSLLNIQHRFVLEQLFLSNNQLEWRNAQVIFPLVVQLLEYEEYRYVIWKNCLITSGDSTEKSLAGASCALNDYLKLNEKNVQLFEFLLNDLLQLFLDTKNQLRIYHPCIQAFERLLSQSTFQWYYDHHQQHFLDICFGIIHSIESTVRGKQRLINDMKLNVSIIRFYCSLIQFNNPKLKNEVIALLTNYFQHEYPWIRRQAAQHLYEACITYADCLLDNNEYETILNILTETNWDQNIEQLMSVKQTLLKAFSCTQTV
ncbi:unnamed protein product [Didymodactylos carnosus]|uniref:Tubulin-specific chaperone D n=1 Tax=Didymodactylos carnosus TaxID=1234261 RepID=A0A814PID5_9BILA|nr:unnamed protein product [Didymodactylos carnosus]CAF3870235.1 unnamed protein product [Didymodactylos carnosus]